MKKVLIVDDEPLILQSLSDCLTFNGYEAITALTAREGFEQIEREKPDLIALDIMLPDMEGNTMCHMLKKEQGLKTPVIMMTNKIDVVDPKRARKMGADDFAVKTAGYNPLMATIRKHCQA